MIFRLTYVSPRSCVHVIYERLQSILATGEWIHITDNCLRLWAPWPSEVRAARVPPGQPPCWVQNTRVTSGGVVPPPAPCSVWGHIHEYSEPFLWRRVIVEIGCVICYTGCCKTTGKLWQHITETLFGVFLLFLGSFDCQIWAIFHFGTLWANEWKKSLKIWPWKKAGFQGWLKLANFLIS